MTWESDYLRKIRTADEALRFVIVKGSGHLSVEQGKCKVERKPPFGVVGKAMNAVVGYLIAEVSLHRFLSDVAAYLRQTLAK